MDLPARFWEKVIVTPDHWLWTAAHNDDGYAKFKAGGKLLSAHRLTYEWWHGEAVPAPLVSDHWCQFRGCVNPMHVRPATVKQNGENRAVVHATSGHRGVHQNGDGWTVVVWHNGERHYGGRFTDPDQADAAARALRDELFTHHDLMRGRR